MKTDETSLLIDGNLDCVTHPTQRRNIYSEFLSRVGGTGEIGRRIITPMCCETVSNSGSPEHNLHTLIQSGNHSTSLKFGSQ